MSYQIRTRRSLSLTALAAFATLSLTACTQIPELDDAVPNWVRRADYPHLTALDPSVTTMVLPQDSSEELEQEMTARQNNLERKAKQLKALDPDGGEAAQTPDEITQ